MSRCAGHRLRDLLLLTSCLVLLTGCLPEPEVIVFDDEPPAAVQTEEGEASNQSDDPRVVLQPQDVAKVLDLKVEAAVSTGKADSRFQTIYTSPTGRPVAHIHIEKGEPALAAFAEIRTFPEREAVEELGNEAYWIPVLNKLSVLNDATYIVITDVQGSRENVKARSIDIARLVVERLNQK